MSSPRAVAMSNHARKRLRERAPRATFRDSVRIPARYAQLETTDTPWRRPRDKWNARVRHHATAGALFILQRRRGTWVVKTVLPWRLDSLAGHLVYLMMGVWPQGFVGRERCQVDVK